MSSAKMSAIAARPSCQPLEGVADRLPVGLGGTNVDSVGHGVASGFSMTMSVSRAGTLAAGGHRRDERKYL
jgi:hypothetical protein